MVHRFPGALLAALLLATGCGDAPDGSRRVEAVGWDTTFVIGGGVDDTTLIRPWLLSAGSGGVFDYDYGSSAVQAFDAQGRHRWTHGRPGSGPGELRSPIGMTIAPDGRVWLVDAGAGRIAVLDPAGFEHALLPLPETPQRLVHLGPLPLAVLFASDDQFSVRLEDDGTWTDHLDYPVGPIEAPPVNLRVIRAATNSASGPRLSCSPGRSWCSTATSSRVQSRPRPLRVQISSAPHGSRCHSIGVPTPPE